MGWKCSSCTYVNSNDTFLACECCGSERLSSDLIEVVAEPKVESKFFYTATAAAAATPPTASTATTSTTTAPARPTRSAPKALKLPDIKIKPSDDSDNGEKQIKDKLKPIYDEFVNSEKHYVHELEVVIAVFLHPLKSRANDPDTVLLSENEVNVLFGNTQEILRVNQEFLTHLENEICALPKDEIHLSERKVEALCKAFLKTSAHLKLYAVYAIQYEMAAQKLKQFESERYRFAEFLQAVSAMNSSTGHQHLSSFLIKPIQRVCKYPLFFKTMLKAVDENDPVRAVIEQAHAASQGVASKINADKLRAEQSLRAFEVARRFESLGDVVLESGRRYLGEWKCFFSEGDNSLAKKKRSNVKNIVVSVAGASEKKYRTFFMFNDVLIVAKEMGVGSKMRYEIRNWMSMNSMQISGVNVNDPRVKDNEPVTPPGGWSTSNNVPPSSPANNGAGGGEMNAANRSKFTLPLDIIHFSSADREKSEKYREQQEKLHSLSHLGVGRVRRASLSRKKSSDFNGPSNSSQNELITIKYTLWFRSGAERQRVWQLLDKTKDEHENKLLTPIARSSSAQSVVDMRRFGKRSSTLSVSGLETPTSSVSGAGFLGFADRSKSMDDFCTFPGDISPTPRSYATERSESEWLHEEKLTLDPLHNHSPSSPSLQPATVHAAAASAQRRRPSSLNFGANDVAGLPARPQKNVQFEENHTVQIVSKLSNSSVSSVSSISASGGMITPVNGGAATSARAAVVPASQRPRPRPPPPPLPSDLYLARHPGVKLAVNAVNALNSPATSPIKLKSTTEEAIGDDQLISKWFG